MSRMFSSLFAAAMATVLLAGCSGQYILTVPEQVGPAAGQAIIVSRLQMVEFGSYHPAVSNLAMRCTVENLAPRCAYTDKYGYAAVSVPLPPEPGVYHVEVASTDKDGREVQTFAPVYVLQKDFPVVAIDLDALTLPPSDEMRDAMKTLGEQANVVYLTKRSTSEHPSLHAQLALQGLPDGPILLWERQFFHMTPMGMVNMMVVENRMVSQLPGLRQNFPNLRAGISDSPLAIDAFRAAGLIPVYVGQEGLLGPKVGPDARRSNWSELAAKGLGVAR